MASADEECKKIEDHLKSLLLSGTNAASKSKTKKKKQGGRANSSPSSSSSLYSHQLDAKEWPMLASSDLKENADVRRNRQPSGENFQPAFSYQSHDSAHSAPPESSTKGRSNQNFAKHSDRTPSKFENRNAEPYSSLKGRRRERSYSEGDPNLQSVGRNAENMKKNQQRSRHATLNLYNGEVSENGRLTKLVGSQKNNQKKDIVKLSPQSTTQKPVNSNAGFHNDTVTLLTSFSPLANQRGSPQRPVTQACLDVQNQHGFHESSPSAHQASKRTQKQENKKSGSPGYASDLSSGQLNKAQTEEDPAQKAKKKPKKKAKRERNNSQQEAPTLESSSPPQSDRQQGKFPQGPPERQQKLWKSVKQQNHEREVDKRKGAMDQGTPDKSGRNNRDRMRRTISEELFSNPKMLKKLEDEHVQYARRVLPDDTHVVFTCIVCGFITFSVKSIRDHITYKSHRQKKVLYQDGIHLDKIPPPSQSQVDALTELLEQIAAEQQISIDDEERHQDVVSRLNEILQKEFPECKLRLFGSLAYGLGLKGAGIDLNLEVTNGTNPADVFTRLYEVLKQHADFQEVTTDFFSKIPSLECVDKKTGFSCYISWNNTAACNTSALIADYVAVDDRVKKLAIPFRYWAKLCGIDDQKKDMLPSYCYVLMLIYFLQQHHPHILPVFFGFSKSTGAAASGNTESPEKYTSPQNAILNWKVQNKESLGELWLKLFEFYSIKFKYSEFVISVRQFVPMKQADRRWHAKGLAIEDPFLTKRNVARCVSSSTFGYIREMFKIAYKYFAIPQLSTGPLFTSLPSAILELSPEEILDAMCDKDNKGLNDDLVVVSDSTKNDLSELNLLDDIDDRGSEKSNGDLDDEDSSSSVVDDLLNDHDPDVSVDDFVAVMSEMDLSEHPPAKEEENQEAKKDNSSQEIAADIPAGQNQQSEDNDVKKLPPGDAMEKIEASMRALKKDEIIYKFDSEYFTSGKVPPLYCRHCQKMGHLKQDCPEDKLPPLLDLPPPNPQFIRLLDNLFQKIMRELIPSSEEIEERHELLKQLETYIQELYEDAKLELFGSSCNGFGFTQSDLDICLTFDSKETGKDLNHVQIIEALAERLKKHKELYNVIPITTAKVPIVKFVHRNTRLDGDISLYNTLAKHNTRMLNIYSKIDDRVRILGYVMKYFAKVCDICDASRGSLSSYAYILMVLYFLQQRNPPVIPVLQELYDKSKDKPEVLVDGWNAWFYDDVKNLMSVWPEHERNMESVGELWLGLLKFYTEEFDFEKYTISIRQKDPLSRLTKMWTSSSIAIEDPFNLKHNLGAGVSRKMSRYILSAFVHGRNLFGLPPKHLIMEYQDAKQFLFDRRLLTDGAPPNDRGCHRCGKIGHKLKDCPRKIQSPGQKRNQQQNRNQQQQNRNQDSMDRRDNHAERGQNNDNLGNRSGNRNQSGNQGTNAKKNIEDSIRASVQPPVQQQSQHQQAFPRLLGPGFPLVSVHQSSLTTSTVGSATHNSGMPCQLRSPPIIPACMPQPFSGQAMPKLAANLGNKPMPSAPAETPSTFAQNWPNRENYQQAKQPNFTNFPQAQRAPVNSYVPLIGSTIPPFAGTPNMRPPSQQNAVPYTNVLLFQQVPYPQQQILGQRPQASQQTQQLVNMQRMYEAQQQQPPQPQQSGPVMCMSGMIPGRTAPTADQQLRQQQQQLNELPVHLQNPLVSNNPQPQYPSPGNNPRSRELFMHLSSHQIKGPSQLQFEK